MIDGNFSYIQSVFPNYKTSEINSLAQIKTFAPNKIPVPTTTDVDEIYKKFVTEKQSNSYFYNTPLSLEKITSPLLGKPITNLEQPKLEKMTIEQQKKELTDEDYISYVLKSEHCKEMIINALKLESSKKQNNMIIEFVAFVLIGLFLLYLLNR